MRHVLSNLLARQGEAGLAAAAAILGGLAWVAAMAAFTVFPWLELVGLGQRVVLGAQLGFYALLGSAMVRLLAFRDASSGRAAA